jgi:single stranded DNA-binding protein
MRPEIIASRVIPLRPGIDPQQEKTALATLSSCLNLAILVGTVGHDPELGHSTEDEAIACFSLLVSQPWSTAGAKTQDMTEWFNIMAQGPLAEVCHAKVSQGHRVYVEGEVRLAEHPGSTCDSRYGIMVLASEILPLDRPSPAQEEASDPETVRLHTNET